MAVVVAGIGIGIGAKVLTNVDATYAANSTAKEISGNATAGIGEVGDWFPTIGLVVAAAIVLGLLIAAFYFKKEE